jgi:hypothetical protein
MVKLSDYTWGFGLEHEMHIFHIQNNKKGAIKDVILFDGQSVKDRLLENTEDENKIEFINSVPFEPTGRLCNGKWVIERVGCLMPEFITSYPMCSIKTNRYIKNMIKELQLNTQKYLKMLEEDEIVKKQVKKYGSLGAYPYSMTSYLREPENSKLINYNLKPSRIEYLGSYHITITLPHLKTITQTQFIKNHQNFANQLQWLEPLLLTAFFSCDQRCIGTKYNRVKGSFRVMMIGWGNFAGSDVRKFNKGIGRYTNIKTYWRNGLTFTDSDKLQPCYKPSPSAIKEKGLSSLSSNFRTFGSTDPKRPDHRESGAPMTKPNGIEFRIFDHFDDKYLEELCKLIVLVAENSRLHQTKEYVYKNKYWINAMHSIMKEGWKTLLEDEFIELLRKQLNLKIKNKSNKGYDVLCCISDELYNKHKSGDYTKIMTGYLISKKKIINSTSKKIEFEKENLRKPNIPQINRESINYALCLKLNNDKKLFNNFKKLINQNLDKNYNYKDFKKIFFKYFDKSLFNKNYDDFIYFMESHNLLKLDDFMNIQFNNKTFDINNMNIFMKN